MSTTQLILVFVAVCIIAWWLSMVAGRIDRVHIRRDEAEISLRLQLAWRASAVAKLLNANVLDPVSADVLSKEVENVAAAGVRSLSEYLAAESEMTATLGQIFDDAEAVSAVAASTRTAHLLTELASTCRRVQLARRFHNDAVGAAQLLRRRPVVRWFRLAGRTPWPQPLDLADEVPTGLAQFA